MLMLSAVAGPAGAGETRPLPVRGKLERGGEPEEEVRPGVGGESTA